MVFFHNIQCMRHTDDCNEATMYNCDEAVTGIGFNISSKMVRLSVTLNSMLCIVGLSSFTMKRINNV